MQNEVATGNEVPQNILKRYFKQMPIFFPLIGLFLLALALIEIFSYATDDGYGTIYLLRPALFLLYFLFWSLVCLAKKWGAFGFLFLTIAGMAFFLFAPDIVLKHAIGDVLILPIPANVFFSFLLLFYFRRMK